jgi:tetratricopeptide (TPR) repeat protein
MAMRKTAVGLLALSLTMMLVAGMSAVAGAAPEGLQEAIALLGQGRYQEAQATCEGQFLQGPAEEAAARLVLAEIWAAQGQFDSAVEQASKAHDLASSLQPADPALTAQAEAAVERIAAMQQTFDDRVAKLQADVASGAGTPKGWQALLALGDTFTLNGRFDDALEQYGTLSQATPISIWAERAAARMGLVYDATGKPDEARQAYLLSDSLGVQLRFESQGKAQVAQYQATLAASPGDDEAAEVRYKIACIYAQYLMYDQAIAELAGLIDTFPTSAPAAKGLDLLVMLFIQSERADQAVEVLVPLVDDHYADEPVALVGLCGVYLRAGDTTDAESTAKGMLRDYPDSEQVAGAVTELKATYEAAGNTPEATAGKLRALPSAYPGPEVGPAVDEGIEQLASAYYYQGTGLAAEDKYAEALALFDKALALRPPADTGPKAAYQKAICYHALGDDPQAIAAFKAVIQEYPDAYLAIRAANWIERLEGK